MKNQPVTAYIALGANLGDAATAVVRAMDAIAALPAIRVTQRSSLYASAPVDADGPDYVNAVVEVETTLPAPLLLTQLQRLEQEAGRERLRRNAPRTLDLDLLLYGDATIRSETLTVPHPRMERRAFVLLPLAQIAPQRVAAELLERVRGQRVQRL